MSWWTDRRLLNVLRIQRAAKFHRPRRRRLWSMPWQTNVSRWWITPS
jgi:hypothetical protein